MAVPMLTEQDLMLLLLTWAAGSMDALSYLGLDHVLTANMTGNTVLLGLAIGQGRTLDAFRSLTALAGFILGVGTGAVIVQRGSGEEEWPTCVTAAIIFEGCVLSLFALIWFRSGHSGSVLTPYALILLSALTMGVQSAAVRRLRVPGVVTTFITGTITSVVSGFVSGLRRRETLALTRKAGTPPPKQHIDWEHRIELQVMVFLIYSFGAIATAIADSRLPAVIAFLPLAAVGCVILIAAMRKNV